MAKRIIRQQKPRQDIPDYLRKYLETGQEPESGDAGAWDILMLDLAKAWETHGKKILRDWIETKPFSRPWAFWEVAPENRKQVKGKKIKALWPSDICYDFGVPVYSASFALGKSANKIKKSDFETELQYLTRLDLLTAAEKKLLKLHKCK